MAYQQGIRGLSDAEKRRHGAFILHIAQPLKSMFSWGCSLAASCNLSIRIAACTVCSFFTDGRATLSSSSLASPLPSTLLRLLCSLQNCVQTIALSCSALLMWVLVIFCTLRPYSPWALGWPQQQLPSPHPFCILIALSSSPVASTGV